MPFNTTHYFDLRRNKPDRVFIKNEWIEFVLVNPLKQSTQADGRFRMWGKIKEMNNRYLRVVLLEDKKTVHNAFFDRRFTP